ncbi:MAG: hypothetical protein EPN64_08980 [Burkholderiaceae bacterium]|nr:MAG: hypothetical protein EPN64_08980 [Burkholderiaceae bacterium]
MSDADLKKIATKAKKPHRTTTTVTVITRDQNVVAYVKRRANGRCELCGELAPFEDTKGAPFLECHHVVWLANDGLDSHENAVALCPNCHRKMHVLARKADVETLKKAAS